MAFQTQVNRYLAEGVAGQKATPNQSIYTPTNYLAEGEVKVGSFVFAGTKPNQAKQTGEGQVLGLVERTMANFMTNLKQEALSSIEDKGALTIAVRGDYYVQVSAQAHVGDAVFASQTDGSIKTATAGSTQSGYTETNWTVKSVLSSGSSGGLILISNWDTKAMPTGSSGGGQDLSNYYNKSEVDSTFMKKSEQVNLASGVTGVLPIANGGTSKGSADEALQALGGIKKADKVDLTQDVKGILPIANGGTGKSSE